MEMQSVFFKDVDRCRCAALLQLRAGCAAVAHILVSLLDKMPSSQLSTDWSRKGIPPMANGRPREFDTELALDRAMELFWRKGYEGTSLSDLTETLGVTRPSLYAAFGNKEALFRTVLKRYEANVGIYRVKALNAPTAQAVARALLDGAANVFGDKNSPAGCLGVQGALACGDDADPIRRELIEHRTAGERAIMQRLKRAKAEGDLPADSVPASLARYLSAVLYGMAVLAAGGASRKELLQVSETALQAWPLSPLQA